MESQTQPADEDNYRLVGFSRTYAEFLSQAQDQELEAQQLAYNQALGRCVLASLEVCDRPELQLAEGISQLSLQLNHRSARQRIRAEAGLDLLWDLLAEADDDFMDIRDDFDDSRQELWETIADHYWEKRHLRALRRGPLASKLVAARDELKIVFWALVDAIHRPDY